MEYNIDLKPSRSLISTIFYYYAYQKMEKSNMFEKFKHVVDMRK